MRDCRVVRFSPSRAAAPFAPPTIPFLKRARAERARILQVLKETKGMVGGANGAAARLGLKRTTLQSRMRKFNIARLFQ